MPDALSEMAAAAVQASPALQSRVAGFVDDVLDEAFDLMLNGTPKMKADLINKLVPHLVRQLADKAEDDEVKTMRAEMNELRQGMQGSVGVGRERQAVDEDGTPENDDYRAQILAMIPRDKPDTPSPVTSAAVGGVKIKRRQ